MFQFFPFPTRFPPDHHTWCFFASFIALFSVLVAPLTYRNTVKFFQVKHGVEFWQEKKEFPTSMSTLRPDCQKWALTFWSKHLIFTPVKIDYCKLKMSKLFQCKHGSPISRLKTIFRKKVRFNPFDAKNKLSVRYPTPRSSLTRKCTKYESFARNIGHSLNRIRS